VNVKIHTLLSRESASGEALSFCAFRGVYGLTFSGQVIGRLGVPSNLRLAESARKAEMVVLKHRYIDKSAG
jgi:hypothetical protein